MDSQNITKELQGVLPNSGAKRIAKWTVIAAIACAALLQFLRPVLHFWQEETQVMLQVSAVLLTLLVGSFLIILNLLKHIKNIEQKWVVEIVEPTSIHQTHKQSQPIKAKIDIDPFNL